MADVTTMTIVSVSVRKRALAALSAIAVAVQSSGAQTGLPAETSCELSRAFLVRDADTDRPISEVAVSLTPVAQEINANRHDPLETEQDRDSMDTRQDRDSDIEPDRDSTNMQQGGDSLDLEPHRDSLDVEQDGDSPRTERPRRSEQPGERSITRFTDAAGSVRFDRLCPGLYKLETVHVGYITETREIRVQPTPAGESEPINVLSLVSRVYAVEEVDVRAETVTPLVSLERSSRVVPSETAISFASYDLVDAIRLVPGVLVRGDRVFFRGVATEHVATTIDGVPARHPITGEWILPPPEAVIGAELIASTVVAESAPSLGGLLALRLVDGKDRQTSRLVYGTDGGWGEGDGRTDTFHAMSAGPTSLAGLSYAGAYRGVFASGSLSYDRALPEQSILGIGTLGRRMSGEEAASFKLSWEEPEETRWRANAAVISTQSRGKRYQANYARSGWVGYSPQFDRYTQFLEEPPVEGRDQFYEGPRHVPVEERRSTLLYATASRDLESGMRMQAHLFHGDHAMDTEHAGVELESEAALEAWETEAITDQDHQAEQFYALHGDLPVYTRGRSREFGGGVSSGWKLSDHELRAGLGVQRGRHRYLTVIPPSTWWIGSLDEPLTSWDGSGYLQDTWKTDERSWLQISLRYDARDVKWKNRSTFAARWSPALAFHQPMSAADELHVEAGQSYQFPALQSLFPGRLAAESAPPVHAQRVRFAEVGFQHHFSTRAVGYVGARDRQYSDVIFAERTPSALEELTGARTPPASSIEQRELEISLDLQLSAALHGQTSFVWSRTTAEELAGEERTEVPWSRRGYLRSWMVWRGGHGFSSTIAFSWDSGRPYDVCLIGRGCSEAERIRGKLPSQAHADWAASWTTDLAGAPLELSVEVQNLFDARPPSYDFSSFPMAVTADHFLGYWDATGKTGGYLRDHGNSRDEIALDNPQTRGLGRSVLIAVGSRF